jgi:hypothetical protein
MNTNPISGSLSVVFSTVSIFCTVWCGLQPPGQGKKKIFSPPPATETETEYDLRSLFFLFWNETLVQCTLYFCSTYGTMPVSQQETTLSTGHIPSYLWHQYHQLIALLLDQRAWHSWMLSHLCYFCPQLLPVIMQYSNHRSTSHLLHSLFMSLYHYSYDVYIRPTVLFD